MLHHKHGIKDIPVKDHTQSNTQVVGCAGVLNSWATTSPNYNQPPLVVLQMREEDVFGNGRLESLSGLVVLWNNLYIYHE